MAFKQPRVPQMQQGMNLATYIYELILFLKDFTMASWKESQRHEEAIEAMQKEIEAMKSEIAGTE